MTMFLSRRYVAAILTVGLAGLLAAIGSGSSKTPSVQEYYTSLESRLGYWLFLGRARHCGWWEQNTIWPFPIAKAQRTMEEKLYLRLGLPNGSSVLDAGAGSGIVAVYMAERGLNLHAIDLTPLHVEQARQLVGRRHLEPRVSVSQMDYHDLSSIPDNTFDGIYTMETFVHADDAHKVLRNFHRVLRPGGVIVLHEADFHWDSPVLQDILRLSHCRNTLRQGSYQDLLAATGFVNIEIEDLTANVLPLWRLLAAVGSVPYDVLRLLGAHRRFTNLMSAVEIYRNWGQGRYISVRAVNGP